jgi:predicted amidophosphoribosyltransferase
VGEHTFVTLPSDIHAWLHRLRERDILLPPLEPPECCERCERPLEPEKQRFGTCWECGHAHGPSLEFVAAATYAAPGTAPWELLREAKFRLLDEASVAQRVAAITAAMWETIEKVASEFFAGGRNVTVPIPSSRDLMLRCGAEAQQRGWPTLAFDQRLEAEDRPRQSASGSAAERCEAAQGKYYFNGGLQGDAILLLDDVYTSGYTMHDAARAVCDAGAISVVGVVYARRVFPDVMALYREARDV